MSKSMQQIQIWTFTKRKCANVHILSYIYIYLSHTWMIEQFQGSPFFLWTMIFFTIKVAHWFPSDFRRWPWRCSAGSSPVGASIPRPSEHGRRKWRFRLRLGDGNPMTDPWCCYIWYHDWGILMGSMLPYIPAPWIRHGNGVHDERWTRGYP